MMKSLRKVLALLSVCCVQFVVAQNISVASFKLLENDLTANTTGSMERDQNGEIAALIKVVTTEQNFVFDGGMTGIVKTKQEIGEVWVYVPHGIKKITVKHPQLGVLRDYYFPVPIDKAKTYEMVLTTGKVETIVTRSANKQYVVFNVNPANAMVELDNMPLDVSSDGYAEKSMPYGTYSYRVSCANYHTEAGQVTVTSQDKAEVSVTLRPNFGWIEFSGDEELHGAHIYVDNERIGQLPMKSGEMKIGVHQIKVLKPLYRPYEQQVTVTEGNTTQIEVKLKPNFANVTFVTDAESEIWVDDKLKGKGQCTIDLEAGEYMVEVKRESHRTVSEVINIIDNETREVRLPSPVPIYGILNITSNPSRAVVFMDSVEIGETPLLKNDVLIGTHQLVIKKKDLPIISKLVEIKEGEENQLALSFKEDSINIELIDSIKLISIHKYLIKRDEKKKVENAVKLYKKRNYAKAFEEFSFYALQNNSYAQYYLGEFYFYGRGVDVDYVKAVNWYRESANQNNADAQYKLGYCYEMGKGVTRNKREANIWYRKAAKENSKARYKAEMH